MYVFSVHNDILIVLTNLSFFSSYYAIILPPTDSTRQSGTRLVGDVLFDEAKQVASFVTPVPCGVGPMTVAMLMKNTVRSALTAAEKLVQTTWDLAPLTLAKVRPVPS